MLAFDEVTCIKEVQNGNVAAFESLVNHYKSKVYTISYKIIKNREDAQEIAQDTFIKVFKNIKNFKSNSKLSTWLYRIVYNEAISKIRKKKNDHLLLEQNYDIVDEEDTYKNFLTLRDTEQRKFIEQALYNLDEDESVLLTLFYLEENSIEELQEITGLTQSNIKVKLHRGRKKLYAELSSILKGELQSIM
jgi:RNA polymerase sigma factor (sigma-70 family)